MPSEAASPCAGWEFSNSILGSNFAPQFIAALAAPLSYTDALAMEFAVNRPFG
jgi:hypothetical protein